ncbi:hypothetical protein FIBSPDRAFT_888428 [Athelia psychrophila]|uniref:Uncharacterized protein n=1 Tax=Athelia psychrophila TaxID=1759441 RepID=A0A166NGC0_9AGAM|nr:hypothetical protein FIBSPDRAFT_888428 [Fibularhizoctonia sp. CBS 109695]
MASVGAVIDIFQPVKLFFSTAGGYTPDTVSLTVVCLRSCKVALRVLRNKPANARVHRDSPAQNSPSDVASAVIDNRRSLDRRPLSAKKVPLFLVLDDDWAEVYQFDKFMDKDKNDRMTGNTTAGSPIIKTISMTRKARRFTIIRMITTSL